MRSLLEANVFWKINLKNSKYIKFIEGSKSFTPLIIVIPSIFTTTTFKAFINPLTKDTKCSH